MQIGRTRTRFMVAALLIITAAVTLAGGAYSGLPFANAAVPAGQQPAAQSKILVVHVYYRNDAERDNLATEFGAEEVSTKDGYLTFWTDQSTYNEFLRRGLRVEIDQKTTNDANNPHYFDTFYSGYKTVEEIYTFLDQEVAAHPTLAVKVDYGDSWCKVHAGTCIRPRHTTGTTYSPCISPTRLYPDQSLSTGMRQVSMPGRLLLPRSRWTTSPGSLTTTTPTPRLVLLLTGMTSGWCRLSTPMATI